MRWRKLLSWTGVAGTALEGDVQSDVCMSLIGGAFLLIRFHNDKDHKLVDSTSYQRPTNHLDSLLMLVLR